MNKPYLLIAGDNYYPSADTGDWVGCFSTYEEAKAQVEPRKTNGKLLLVFFGWVEYYMRTETNQKDHHHSN